MTIFAIELSSQFGSVALIKDGNVVAEKQWKEDFKDRQQLFDGIADLQIDWDQVDCFAVGRGPGAFSGMRISLSVANALAAPDNKPVYTLNSGQALTAQIAEQTGAKQIAVVGDARRQKVWAGVINNGELIKDYQLMPLDELAAFIPADTLVVSPDHDRIEELLANFNTLPDAAPVYPTAASLGKLVEQRLKDDIESEPLEPLYMHPPVFIEPRFPA